MLERITINAICDGEMDEISANIYLAAVAEYAEKHGLVIVGERDETGKVVYWFERSKHERNHF